ncbi:hypothetical protein K4F52_001301 [Lecanicillium sp. MT-2017a]|nr:hypothetical protein K4F52_001301 [Lecanicillium sp. MT-2017a]
MEQTSSDNASKSTEMKIRRLFIYPIKSMLPVEVSMAEITSAGFRFDRQYAVVKTPTEGQRLVQHLTIKKTYRLALFQPSINDDWSELGIKCTTAPSDAGITLPLTPSPLTGLNAKSYTLSIFGTTAVGMDMGDGPANFFSKHLDISVRLVFISGNGSREIPGIAYIPKQLTSLTVNTGEDAQPQRIRFADAAPFLVTSTASEKEMIARLPPKYRDEDVMLQLRPNIHIDVGPQTKAFEEDDWRELVVDGADGGYKATLRCVFMTPRCLSLNVDIKTGTTSPREKQLYGLLAKDRRVNKVFPQKPVFGQYAFAAPIGAIIRVGDTVNVTDKAAQVSEPQDTAMQGATTAREGEKELHQSATAEQVQVK